MYWVGYEIPEYSYSVQRTRRLDRRYEDTLKRTDLRIYTS